MPQYNYKCLQCGHTLEVFNRSIADRDDQYCPLCRAYMIRPIQSNLVSIEPNDEVTLENVADVPITFATKTKRDAFLREKGWAQD